ncbi:MAG: hypothetical protein HOE48_10570 [Candidatus Latescibacteria bacterium]|nr:hypothetical protein [Candidatus Latescibacterota bacterium]MBT4138353.1 hypothetical protein [Candidatus Latescibacterota bacterium]MBT5832090.1 hypothetical protein [Candidatus Latescibacterota bacterium]
MNSNIIYRFVVNNTGIYEAVEQACPRNDPRRQNKPDGSWLPKVGQTYPNVISFWTSHGLQTYINSNLTETIL